MCITAGMLLRQTDTLQHRINDRIRLTFFLYDSMRHQRLRDDVAYRHTGIQRSVRILKDHLHLFAHDLSMVRYVSDDVGVMYLGQLVELSEADEIYKHPLHPYT